MVLTSNQGKEFTVDLETAMTVSILVREYEDLESKVVNAPAFLKVDTACLEKIVDYINHYEKDPIKAYVPEELGSKSLAEYFGIWYAGFVDQSPLSLVPLFLAANYMQIPSLVDLISARFASNIQSNPVSVVLSTFAIEGEFTEEEFNKVAQMYPFVKKPPVAPAKADESSSDEEENGNSMSDDD